MVKKATKQFQLRNFFRNVKFSELTFASKPQYSFKKYNNVQILFFATFYHISLMTKLHDAQRIPHFLDKLDVIIT